MYISGCEAAPLTSFRAVAACEVTMHHKIATVAMSPEISRIFGNTGISNRCRYCNIVGAIFLRDLSTLSLSIFLFSIITVLTTARDDDLGAESTATDSGNR